jgi:hypothetical protein
MVDNKMGVYLAVTLEVPWRYLGGIWSLHYTMAISMIDTLGQGSSKVVARHYKVAARHFETDTLSPRHAKVAT